MRSRWPSARRADARGDSDVVSNDDGVEKERLIFEALPFGVRFYDSESEESARMTGESIGSKRDRCASIAQVTADRDDGLASSAIGGLVSSGVRELELEDSQAREFANSPITNYSTHRVGSTAPFGAGAFGAAAQDVGPSRECLFEHPEMLEGFTQDHAQQRAVTGVWECVHSAAPLFTERSRHVPVGRQERLSEPRCPCRTASRQVPARPPASLRDRRWRRRASSTCTSSRAMTY